MRKYFKILLLILPIIIVYRTFFVPGILTSYDWIYQYPENIKHFSLFPVVYKNYFALGINAIIFAGVESYMHLSSRLFNIFGFAITERIAWLFPFLILSVLSAYYLTRSLIGSIIYTTNTYILMILGGGQMGVALSYAFIPFALRVVWDLLFGHEKKLNLKQLLIGSLSFAAILLFDIRVFYIVLLAILLMGIFFLFTINSFQNIRKRLSGLTVLLSIFAFAIISNLFWILPLLVFGTGIENYGDVYTKSSSVSFFSFARFENSFSLLHPNWPENLFGKVYFQRWEFLLIPLMAFSSMFYAIGKDKIRIGYFVILALVGIFLAKGTNEPFGFVYTWLFDSIPGFVSFRDPTKFYMLIVLSYSVLIPITINKVLQSIKQRPLYYLFIFGLLAYLLIILKPAWDGTLTGIYRQSSIPQEYQELSNFINSDTSFYRTLWVPQFQRFGFTSALHPAATPINLFHTLDAKIIRSKISNNSSEEILREASIRYVILPLDSEGEIFLDDRKYSELEYKKYFNSLESAKYLSRVKRIGKVVIYEVRDPFPLFYLPETKKTVSYKVISQTQYRLTLPPDSSGKTLHFSMSMDRGWRLRMGSVEVSPMQKRNISSFTIPDSKTNEAIVYFAPANLSRYGLLITAFLLPFILITAYAVFKIINARRRE